MLSLETKKLLDKLYNLRRDDSVILVSMEKERIEAVDAKERTGKLKKDLEAKLSKLENEESVLADEGKKLQEVLKNIKKEEFSTVVEALKIEFDPDSIRKKIERTLPSTIDKISNDKKESSEQLVKVEDEENAAITKIEELALRKEEALADQERLNHYFDLALSSNINITREEITSLLAKLGLKPEEQREGAKLLMFPEDGLFEYDEHHDYAEKDVEPYEDEYKEETEEVKDEKKEEAEVENKLEKEAPEEAKEEITSEEKKATEVIPTTEMTTDIESNGDKVVNPEEVEVEIEEEEPKIEDQNVEIIKIHKAEDELEATKEELINLLSRLGFDYLDFTTNDFAKLLDDYNEELYTRNVHIINDLKIDKDIFIDNIELFMDKELLSKINVLVAVGKQPQDIYLNPNVLIKYNLDELNDAIKTLKDSGLEPKNVPLMAY